MEEDSKMDVITVAMMKHVCDEICRFPRQEGITQEELEDICASCQMGQHVCNILNTYNGLNDFEKTQLLKKTRGLCKL